MCGAGKFIAVYFSNSLRVSYFTYFFLFFFFACWFACFSVYPNIEHIPTDAVCRSCSLKILFFLLRERKKGIRNKSTCRLTMCIHDVRWCCCVFRFVTELKTEAIELCAFEKCSLIASDGVIIVVALWSSIENRKNGNVQMNRIEPKERNVRNIKDDGDNTIDFRMFFFSSCCRFANIYDYDLNKRFPKLTHQTREINQTYSFSSDMN